MINHDLLQGRLEVEDPDAWGATYEVKDRTHGTAMASLILHGELLDHPVQTSPRRLYVRPIMRPDPADQRNPRSEHTPNDILLIDLVHRAVKRICEGEAGGPASAPTVRVINLSVGLTGREFGREMSPWARLLDWLAHRYSILFIVSAGNKASPLNLPIRRDDIGDLSEEDRRRLAISSLISDSSGRRLLSPGESINALTVGAHHSDSSQPQIPANRYDVFTSYGVSPVSRIGLGYRRAVKPDILMPGGRILFSQSYAVGPAQCVLNPVTLAAAPGHRTAAPPSAGNGTHNTSFCRGTSNAAALASRTAGQIYEVLESLRRDNPDQLPSSYDAVLLKALLVHGALWGDLPDVLLANGPSFDHIEHVSSRQKAKQDFVSRWIGYGVVDPQRSLACAPHRATLIGVGEIGDGEAQVFTAPLPPGLSGAIEWRRVTLTLAWLSPIRPSDQRYRSAKLWIQPPGDTFRVSRENTVDFRSAQRGTVQHEVLEGRDEAMAFVDRDRFVCKVNCKEDAGSFDSKVKFALGVTIEVGVDSTINVYEQIRERLIPRVPVRS